MPLAPEKRIERSADSLQKLYTVIVALSVSQAITSFLKDRDTLSGLGSHESLQAIPALIAFFVTLVPFYHGMNRHLDRCYLERDAGPRQAALLLDFGVFFLESFFLLAASWTIRKGLLSFLFLGLLLLGDCVWGVISHFIHYAGGESTVLRWTVINVMAIAIGLAVGLTTLFGSESRPWMLLVLTTLRTAADYGACWQFYFPRDAH